MVSMPYAAARSAAGLHDTHPDSAVLAAGVLPWRENGRGLELLIIHRPRYDDWSWPKGKLDDGETLPECAVRETLEEIGLPVTLGLPLPSIHYTLNSGTSKEVWYWAAEAGRREPTPDGGEVDRTAWVTPEEARQRLTNPTDREPLEALVAAYERRILRTAPFLVLRHAKAKPRSSWSRAEGERPLAATGRRQALAVARLLAVWSPEKPVSSPWRRCVETVTPYVQGARKSLKTIAAFTEKSAKAKPKKTRRETRALLDRHRSTLLCTHRPVLPLVLEELTETVAGRDTEAILAALPTKDPYLKPGAVIVAHQALDRGGKIVSLEHYDVWDD